MDKLSLVNLCSVTLHREKKRTAGGKSTDEIF
jgi:hypothetical protein